MKKILFVRTGRAFLPEIDAYINYFNNTDEFEAYDSSKLESNYDTNEFDVIWEFKGFGGIKKTANQILVHEYASLSTGKFPLLKNKLKSFLNPKPDFRIYLNEDVRKGFKFNDNVSYCYRDMGIDKLFIDVKSSEKEYDFVYIGSVCKGRGMDKFLKTFDSLKPGKLCLIGDYEKHIFDLYKNNKNIIFTGKIPYSEVPKVASKASYGINYIPNKYPFNIQTSTKLLEYLALNLKVITTDYKWVRAFEKRNNCKFYIIDENNYNFEKKDLENYNFINRFSAKDYLWGKIIEETNIKDKLILSIKQEYVENAIKDSQQIKEK